MPSKQGKNQPTGADSLNQATNQHIGPEKQIESLIDDLTWYKNKFFEFNVSDENSFQQLCLVKTKVAKLEVKYDELFSKLLPDYDDRDRHFDILQLFISLQAAISSKLKAYEMQHEQATSTPVIQSIAIPTAPIQQSIRLPEAALPKFDGSTAQWLEFKANFTNIIINNESVSENLKFYYLKQALSGEALARIQNIPPGDDDFRLAWDLLTQRYHNPRLIATYHISKIESPPSIKPNCSQSLRSFIDFMKININSLEALELGVEIKDLLYLHKILAHLDQSTLQDWERHVEADKILSMQDLWDFLETQCKVWDAVSASIAKMWEVVG